MVGSSSNGALRERELLSLGSHPKMDYCSMSTLLLYNDLLSHTYSQKIPFYVDDPIKSREENVSGDQIEFLH